jgi:pilus assembly protein Flp/PilA
VPQALDLNETVAMSESEAMTPRSKRPKRKDESENIMKTIRSFLRDEAGVTAIEYGLIAALIAVAAVVAMTTLGTNLGTTFTTVSGKL